ncbi:NADH-quinone oxidoreductase subunit N [Rhodohalobacter sulfatireducens]|uniref:NADH-quinone oxidoreductase subunit N n=1 Tax=Rhodohalobacter sulfatireducens TaxID=2911366 RepID=A0ABS9KBR7_9BACT|nr:NADH-quinone oxidoreductase subunit N [Rhodohalobacter sulfatireducens]MCG2588298.1 NADH-quinone oxidoreductase subunit N [Rhodohalobacter sulfatireducens]
MNYLLDLQSFLPGIIVAVAGLAAIMLEAFKKSANTSFSVTIGGIAVALLFAIQSLYGEAGTAFSGMIVYGGVGAFGSVVVLLGALFCVTISREYLRDLDLHNGEVYGMILFSTTGMLGLAVSNDLITLFISLETMSICLYVLAGLMKNEKIGAESALKYFLLGAFSTGFLLYGIALIYGATAATNLTEIAAAAQPTFLFLCGTGLLFVGLFFKVAAVPFHMWTPDVYQGTPTTITAFMATAAKSATFVAFVLVLTRMLPSSEIGDWQSVLQVVAILTMIVGNLIALAQDNVKRMLAYSSIAHAGYLMVGLAAGNEAGYAGVLYYLFAYTIMNAGAFGVIAYYERNHGLDFTEIDSYAGLGFKVPVMGVMLSVFLFSLAGIPPMVGFIGKYYVFAAAVQAGLIPLAIIGVLASAASVYYYLRVMVYLYFKEAHKEYSLKTPGFLFKWTLILLAVLTVYYGVEPVLPTSSLMELISSYYTV